MPRRTNQWQELIHAIQLQLADGAQVTESKELTNRVTGRKREVDILVEAEVGGHTMTIGIECKAGESKSSRPVDVEWVERMIQKHAHLPIHKTVLVAESGFTPQAIELATWSRVDVLTLGDAMATDWTTVVGKLTHLYIAMPQSTPIRCEITYAKGYLLGDMPDLSFDTVLYDGQGRVQGTTLQLANGLLQQPFIGEHVIKNFNEAGDYTFWFDCDVPQGSYHTDNAGAVHELVKLRFHIAVHVEPRIPVALQHRSFKDAQVSFGPIDSLGKGALLAVVEREGKARGTTLRMPSINQEGKITTIAFTARSDDGRVGPSSTVVRMNAAEISVEV